MVAVGIVLCRTAEADLDIDVANMRLDGIDDRAVLRGDRGSDGIRDGIAEKEGFGSLSSPLPSEDIARLSSVSSAPTRAAGAAKECAPALEAAGSAAAITV